MSKNNVESPSDCRTAKRNPGFAGIGKSSPTGRKTIPLSNRKTLVKKAGAKTENTETKPAGTIKRSRRLDSGVSAQPQCAVHQQFGRTGYSNDEGAPKSVRMFPNLRRCPSFCAHSKLSLHVPQKRSKYTKVAFRGP